MFNFKDMTQNTLFNSLIYWQPVKGLKIDMTNMSPWINV